MKILKQEIILGNCLDILRTMDAKCIDVVVTSPPYNIGIKYNTYKDNKEHSEYLAWIKDIFIECKRVLKDSGSIFLNVGSSCLEPWIPYDIANQLRDFLILQNNIIWIKSISIRDDSFGHYKPINSKRFLNHMYEHIFHFTKTGEVPIERTSVGVPYKYKCNLKAVTVTEDIRCRGNTWFIPYETIHVKSQRGDHPAIFPIQLAEWCIKLSGGKVVLDPFMGSGSTIIASKNLDCESIGIEIDPKYFTFAKEKIIKPLKG